MRLVFSTTTRLVLPATNPLITTILPPVISADAIFESTTAAETIGLPETTSTLFPAVTLIRLAWFRLELLAGVFSPFASVGKGVLADAALKSPAKTITTKEEIRIESRSPDADLIQHRRGSMVQCLERCARIIW